MTSERALWAVLAGSAAGALGETMLLVVVNVLMLIRTHSAPAVALLWVVPQVATLATGTLVGRWTDRWDKRRTLWISNALGGVLVFGLFITPNVWAIYGVFGLFAVVDGVFRAAFDPYFRLLVPASRRTRANAVNGALQYGALIVGPAIAGALLLTGHPASVVGVVACALLVSAGFLFFIPALNVPPSQMENTTDHGVNGWWRDLRSVLAFLRGHAPVAGVLLLFRLALVFGATADAQEVVFARRALHLGSSGYGLLVSVAGVGYALGAVATWFLARRVPTRFLVGLGSVGAALGYLAYALAPGLIAAAAGLLALGICQAAASTGFGAFMQGALPPEAMGRITASVRALAAGLTICTTAGGGLLVDRLGVRLWMVGTTGTMVLATVVLATVCLSAVGALEFRRAAAS
jgi:MFS family permease